MLRLAVQGPKVAVEAHKHCPNPSAKRTANTPQFGGRPPRTAKLAEDLAEDSINVYRGKVHEPPKKPPTEQRRQS